jgi:hypothetical protein
MRCRGFFVGLTAALLAVCSVIIVAGPAGAANACEESMNPAAAGNASGLVVGCTFDSPLGTSIIIEDYADAVWHYGAARNVHVTVARTTVAGVPSTAGKTTIKSRPTNNTTVASCVNSPAGQTGIPAGNLEITAADVNHSVENAASSTTLTGIFINPGSFIKTVVATGTGCTKVITVTLNKATLAGGPLCPASPGPATGNCANSVGANVLVSNDTGRSVSDGVTSAGSATVTSASMNFKAGDVGASFSGGDIPDGATISVINSATSATLACAGCVGLFTGVSSHTATVFTITPAQPPTSSRFVTNGSGSGTRVLSGGAAEFAPSDVGLPIAFVPPIATLAGARVGTIAADGSTTTIAGAGTATIPAGAKKFVIGLATKTAPGTGDSQGTLSIVLKTDPSVSPTSPPCAANKISGFHIPLTWRNPQGTAVAPATNVAPAAGYNNFIGGTHLSGTAQPGVSIAQLDFRTASTSFAGYVQQTYTTVASVQGPSAYRVNYTFLPVGIGVCTGTGLAGTWSFFGLTKKIAESPSFTGGGGGGARGITDEAQGTSQVYSGQPRSATSGAYVTVGAPGTNPTNNNSCTISSPALIQIGC